MWKLPPQYCLNLEKTSANNSARELKIVSLASVPQNLRSELVQIPSPHAK